MVWLQVLEKNGMLQCYKNTEITKGLKVTV